MWNTVHDVAQIHYLRHPIGIPPPRPVVTDTTHLAAHVENRRPLVTETGLLRIFGRHAEKGQKCLKNTQEMTSQVKKCVPLIDGVYHPPLHTPLLKYFLGIDSAFIMIIDSISLPYLKEWCMSPWLPLLDYFLCPILLTWINFNSSMEK